MGHAARRRLVSQGSRKVDPDLPTDDVVRAVDVGPWVHDHLEDLPNASE